MVHFFPMDLSSLPWIHVSLWTLLSSFLPQMGRLLSPSFFFLFFVLFICLIVLMEAEIFTEVNGQGFKKETTYCESWKHQKLGINLSCQARHKPASNWWWLRRNQPCNLFRNPVLSCILQISFRLLVLVIASSSD